MQTAKRFRFSAALAALIALLTGCESANLSRFSTNAATTATVSASLLNASSLSKPPNKSASLSTQSAAGSKTGEEPGKLVGPEVDCDGDGSRDEVRIDFDGDAQPDECIIDTEQAIPEPPFQQSYTPSAADFYSRLPAVGWSAKYRCGDGFYEVTLARPDENSMVYSAQGLTILREITYDDLDPNLNWPLIIQDPEKGIRYSFEQTQGNEFYEYAIADYSGSVGFYVYQTGEQIIATPCEMASEISQ